MKLTQAHREALAAMLAATNTDPFHHITKLERSLRNLKYTRKYKIEAIKAQHRADLHLIAQMVGEGLPRERIRNEIIRLAAK